MAGFVAKLLKLRVASFTGRGSECATMKTATVLRVGDDRNQKKDRKLPGIISFPPSNLLRTTITGLIGVQVLSSPPRPRNARVVAGLRCRKAAIAQGALTPSFSANPASHPTDTNYSNSQAMNRTLLIQDFDIPSYPEDSQWTLLTWAQLPATPRATVLPVPDINNHSGREGKGNDFAGMSLTDINVFVRDHEEMLGGLDISAGSWVVIDQKGSLIPKIARSFENIVMGSIGHGVGILARPPNPG
ncbi:hypothetical protein B0H14DRAFT_2623269 [Mycena olivaceomarginata]|nr:hypothetical protein B0H14DRAFT_2623269 [Mycena olivaceomarginata]